MRLLLALWAALAWTATAVAADPPSPRCLRGTESDGLFLDPSRLRMAVVQGHDHDAAVFQALRRLGANAIAVPAHPDTETARLAHESGLFYVAWVSTNDLIRSEDDLDFASSLASVHPLAGVYYEDDAAQEGYATPETQQRAYAQARRLFPCATVLHPTRLDPIAFDPGFLDAYYRPEFTDLVVPYFYPVGTTILGTFFEEDRWRERLRSLLEPLARATAAGKGLLPVLQGFEQIGLPVSRGFLSAQMDVYGTLWPANRNSAVFAWGGGPEDSPLVGFGYRPALQEGVRDLFSAVTDPARIPREVPARR